MIKVKQKWGLAFLLFISFIYVFIYFLGIKSDYEDVKEIYFADRLTLAHHILIEEYNKINKGQIKVIPIDFSNYDFSTNERKELLARSLRGKGDGIDLLAVDVIWAQRFAQWCEPLDKYFSIDEQNQILDLALKSCYTDGKLLTIPLNLSYGIFYYREDILAKYDKNGKIAKSLQDNITWTDFIELGEKLNLETPFYIFPAADYEGLICVYMELLLGLEPDYFTKWGFNFNTIAAQRALTLLVELVHKYKLTPKVVTEFTEIPSYEYFLKHDGLFIRGWQTYEKDFKYSEFDSIKRSNLKEMPIPRFKDGSAASTFGGWNLMIPKFSTKKNEVIDFVKFLLSESSQEIFYKEAGYLPVVNILYEDAKYSKKYPEFVNAMEVYKTGVRRPTDKEYTKYSAIISHYLTLAIKNELSPQKALSEATKEIQSTKMLTY